LLVQDRISEADNFFAKISDAAVTQSIQYDYCAAYLLFSKERPNEAIALAKKYENYPVLRWRKFFADVMAQAEEIAGKGPNIVDDDDRDQQQSVLAATAPALEMKVEDRIIKLEYHNIASVDLNFYLMDLELLFSKNPFVQDVGRRFSVIHPNQTKKIDLPKDKTTLEMPLPKECADMSVMVEAVSSGISRSQAYFPHSLGIQMIESYGQVRVTDSATGKPLPKVYVKVFSRMKGGEIKFFKDGYTDLRGRFDYATLSTNQLDQAERLAILIKSDTHGALVREAKPPKM